VVLPDGSAAAVQEGGRQDAPTLLLLAGQANSHDWWTGLRADFEHDYRTISFDYRGTGSTRATETPWSTRLFAADARHVLGACGVQRAHVYGTSMGGRVAQWLAIDWPDCVDRLVLACSSPGGALATERSTDVRHALAQSDPVARRRALLDLMYTPSWLEQHRTSHLLGDRRMTPRAQQLHLRASAGHDAHARLAEIGSHTLILHGGSDQMVPEANATVLATAIPEAELSVVPDGRHGFFDEFRTEISGQIGEFLSKTS